MGKTYRKAKTDMEKQWKPRQFWTRNPTQRAHSTPKGLRGYKRSDNRREERLER